MSLFIFSAYLRELKSSTHHPTIHARAFGLLKPDLSAPGTNPFPLFVKCPFGLLHLYFTFTAVHSQEIIHKIRLSSIGWGLGYETIVGIGLGILSLSETELPKTIPNRNRLSQDFTSHIPTSRISFFKDNPYHKLFIGFSRIQSL